ncbi:MAG: pro-sigmaK processing inhibitor BofA family protein [Candidatus Methanoperedens sp.]|nr:pro-sigmaK processing inhibitor BofA family protein [Candidatus Methanoperedens sp.]
MAVETIVLVLAIIAVIAVYIFLKAAKYLIVNSILGLILLALGNIIFNLGISYSATAVLICALAGIPGAILIMLLHVFGIAF